MMQTNSPGPVTFRSILFRLFRGPSIVVIGGSWKTGKTDFALSISEKLRAYNIVSQCASNIDTGGFYPQLTDAMSLKNWLYGSTARKLFIFDEASEHLPNTRGMSGKSVSIKGLIPQVSKARARMIIIGHDIKKVDSEVYNDTWCRAIILKPMTPYKYEPAMIYSKLLPRPFKLSSIQPTKIKFDAYSLAPFTERPEKSIYFKDADKDLLYKWATGDASVIGKIPRMTIHRKLKQFIKQTLEAEK